MVKRDLALIVCLVLVLIFFVGIASATTFSFWGYTKNASGSALNATNVSVKIYNMIPGSAPTLNATYSNLSNSSNNGFFNVTNIPIYAGNLMYKFSFIRYNDTSNSYATHIGVSLPDFMGQEISMMINGINNGTFYMKTAGTINITALNRTGTGYSAFQYQMKDTSLGYPISQDFEQVTSALIHVPTGRNYSMMIYPNQSLPVSLEINTLDLNSSIRYFNYTFNLTETAARVYGNVFQSNGTIGGFDSLRVVSYLLEPGRMVYWGDNSMAMYNASFDGEQDIFNSTTGFYNISLIAPAENGSMLLFYVANLSGTFYGGYKHVNLSYGMAAAPYNITLQKLVGSANNISVGWNPQTNIDLVKARINLLNESGVAISQFAHVEIELDYGAWNMTNFTIMTDASGSSAGAIYLPLLNVTGIKRINVFTPGTSPLKKTINASSVQGGEINLTMKEAFNMEETGGGELNGNLFVDMIMHNSTCDVPNYPASCSLFGGSMDKNSANPMQVVFSGAPINFVMRNTNNITVIYVNVDMLASGPPDAIFDGDSNDVDTVSAFEQAWKFGSTGPEIYDYVIIGVPYTEGNTSVTGFNESANFNISIPYLYGDSFSAPIWNSSRGDNITNISNSAGLVDFVDYVGNEYEAYLNGSYPSCNRSDSSLSGLCYLDNSSNMVWFRIKHFSGLGPSITGSVIAAAADDSEDDTGSDSGSNSASGGFWLVTYPTLSSTQFSSTGYSKELIAKSRIGFKVGNATHYLGINSLVNNKTATINVSSTPQIKTLNIGEIWKVNVDADGYYDLLVRLVSVSNSRANITMSSLHEVVEVGVANTTGGVNVSAVANGSASGESDENRWTEMSARTKIVISVIVVLAVILILIAYVISRKGRK